MAKTARERLARLLGGDEPAGAFSARMRASADSLQLTVSGVGPVSFPVRAPMAKKLIAVARPAKFGHGEATLTDTDVRDTWELTPDQITLGGAAWTALMDRALEDFRDALGLPPTTHLRAEPHAMLVYGKGQFFLPHQDSEKDDAMVGTLVVSLPSLHTGGELVVEHAGKSTTYRGSRDDLTFVAFYADCRHEVKPVRSGYRVTLTFNLLADAETPATDSDPATEPASYLTEHFTTSATARYGHRDLGLPSRLVFLLDHEYTQRGLNWERLKGADTQRAALLRAAAERAGCETVLALAEVKETWDALPSDSWRYDYDRIEVEDPGDVELNELIDDEITLGWWTSPDGFGGEPISLYVHDHEVCAVTPSVKLTPYQSEYEGYMGNYGNTMDRWYRRAAVVVWPREKAFAARAEAGSPWALRELRTRIDAGDLDGARTAAESLAPFWKTVGAQQELLGAALDVAAGLDVAGTAAMLLEPFRVETLTQEHADGLAAVTRRYGEDWTRQVIDAWSSSGGGQFIQVGPDGRYVVTDRSEWIDGNLRGLCDALRAESPAIARLLTARAWAWMDDQLRQRMTSTRSEPRQEALERLSSPLLRLLATADDDLRTEITETLRKCDDTVLECLIPALRMADSQPAPWLNAIADDCADRLGAIVAQPLRAEDDWSIDWTGDGCDLCATLQKFLGSRSRRTMEWPLAASGRGHIHSHIDSAELPVRHVTRRTGRPYTLVLTKTDELFTRATNARHKAETDLAWLTRRRQS